MSDDGTYKVYGDLDSRRRNGDLAYVWEKNVHHFEGEESWEESKQLRVANCATRQRGYVSSIRYDKRGGVIIAKDVQLAKVEWDYVVPDSLGETLLEFECAAR